MQAAMVSRLQRSCWYMGELRVKKQKSKAFDKYCKTEGFAAGMEGDAGRGRYTNFADLQRRFEDIAEL